MSQTQINLTETHKKTPEKEKEVADRKDVKSGDVWKLAEVPDHLKCPITLHLFDQPVIASDGHTYEKSAIQTNMQHDKKSPFTRKELLKTLYPNVSIRTLCVEFKEKVWHGEQLLEMIADHEWVKMYKRPLLLPYDPNEQRELIEYCLDFDHREFLVWIVKTLQINLFDFYTEPGDPIISRCDSLTTLKMIIEHLNYDWRKMNKNQTLLMSIVDTRSSEWKEMCSYLFTLGAYIDEMTDEGRTVLSCSKSIDTTKWLIE